MQYNHGDHGHYGPGRRQGPVPIPSTLASRTGLDRLDLAGGLRRLLCPIAFSPAGGSRAAHGAAMAHR
jgi:hypothetical protein